MMDTEELTTSPFYYAPCTSIDRGFISGVVILGMSDSGAMQVERTPIQYFDRELRGRGRRKRNGLVPHDEKNISMDVVNSQACCEVKVVRIE